MTQHNNQSFQVIIVGAGATGLFCAAQLSQHRIKTLLLEHNDRPGLKILISGGGRCNFTNKGTTPANYLSENPHFPKSALARFNATDFLELVKKYSIPFFEKKEGQLFCQKSSKDILELLLAEIDPQFVKQIYSCDISDIKKTGNFFLVETNKGLFQSASLVVASGGLSFKNLGASSFGYNLARQFNIDVIAPQPALVPLECSGDFKKYFSVLSGISFRARVSIGKISFTDDVLLTHHGLSGPAILQISSYWRLGDSLSVNLFPDDDIETQLKHAKESGSKQLLANFLSRFFSDRLVDALLDYHGIDSKPLNELPDKSIRAIALALTSWQITPTGTLGYGKAEVTRGGVSTSELSSQTLESKKVPGLYFIGEVVDVTGWLGGYNFQWAWASAKAAALNIKKSH